MKAFSRNKIIATRLDSREHEIIEILSKQYFKGGVSDLIKAAALNYVPRTSYCFGTKIDPLKVFLIDQLVEIGRKTIDPIQVIVFGSQGRGNFNKDSDVDMVFVVDDSEVSSNSRLASKIGVEEIKQKIKDPVDILVRKKSEIYGAEYQNKELVKNIRRDGVIVYEKI